MDEWMAEVANVESQVDRYRLPEPHWARGIQSAQPSRKQSPAQLRETGRLRAPGRSDDLQQKGSYSLLLGVS